MRRTFVSRVCAWLLPGLLGLAAAGCAARLLHRGGAPASPPPAGASTEDGGRRARKDKSRGESAAIVPDDPLGEARARTALEPGEPWWPTRAAELEAAAGHPDAAEASLKVALARDSTYAPALTRLSRMLYAEGRHAEAVRLLAPFRDPHAPLDAAERDQVLAGLALHEAALGDDAEARAVLGQLAHGGREQVAGVAAYLAVRGSSADSAAKLTEAALRAAPESAANHNNRGIVLLRGADPDAAAKEFERAIALDPSLPGPYYNLAILERWYRLDRVAAAKRFQEYWTRSHADPDSLYAELGHAPVLPVAEEGHR